MRHSTPPRFWLASLAFIATGAVACASQSDSDSNTDDDGREREPSETRTDPIGTLEEECVDACANQTGCPNDLLPSNCTDSCVRLGQRFPACADAWTRLNHCMATDSLECDAQGYSATFNEACLRIVQEMSTCLSETDL